MPGVVYLSAERVQQWLEKTKFAVTDIDAARENTAKNVVFGRVGARYDTTGWIGANTTPGLILDIMSGFYAAWTYNSIISEDYGDSDYARNLLRQLDGLLDSISSGELDIIEVVPLTLAAPAFFPTDAQELDEQGNEIKFKMGVTF